MLTKVKLALRISTNYFDNELNELIAAAKIDLKIAGVDEANIDESNPMISRCICTYCKIYFGDNDKSEMLKIVYDEMKAQLRSSSDFNE